MTQKTTIFERKQNKKLSSPRTITTASDDFVLDSLSGLPNAQSLQSTDIAPREMGTPSPEPESALSVPEKEQTRQEAKASAQKESIKSAAKSEQVMQDIIQNAPRVLFACRATFPFDFFPDEISIEETRINIIQREFWASAEIKAVGIEDITEVAVNTSLFFATLKIGSRTLVDNLVEINFLRKPDAMRARRIIEGLRVLHAQKVEVSALELSLLVPKVEEIGAMQKPAVT